MKIAVLNISTQLLIESLHLPEGTTIQDVRMSFDHPNTLEFRVSSEGLRDVPEGSMIPKVGALFKRESEKVSFMEWQYF